MIHYGQYGQIIEDTIRRAKFGDTYAAKELMEKFCGAIIANTDKDGKPYKKPSGAGTQIDERIIRYFGECFGQILKIEETTQSKKSEKAMKVYDALHLKKGTVQANPDRKKKEMDIAIEVMDLIDCGVTQTDAFGLVAGKYYPDNGAANLLGSCTSVVCKAGRYYPEGGNRTDKGLKATREAYYRYNIGSLAKKCSKLIQQEKDQQ